MGQMLESLTSAIAAGVDRAHKVRWFSEWNARIDDAVSALPALDLCPPELLRELYEVCSVPKRLALVEVAGEPVAVVPLKNAWGRWSPVTTWVLPGTLFPSDPECVLDALAAVNAPVFIGWWRQKAPPPEHSAIAELRAVPAHRLACIDEDETYWRETGLLAKIRRARRRCAELRVEVNRPGAAQWVLEHWSRRWAPEGRDRVPDAPEREAVARYWEPRGRHVSVSLVDGDEIAAAATMFVQERDAIGLCNYRRREYDKLLAGTRLFDAAHQWALSAGIESMDFGSDHDYKTDWAPEGGTKWTLTIDAQPSLSSRVLNAFSGLTSHTLGR